MQIFIAAISLIKKKNIQLINLFLRIFVEMESSSSARTIENEEFETDLNSNSDSSLLKYRAIEGISMNIDKKLKNDQNKDKIIEILESFEGIESLTKEKQKEIENLYELTPWLSQIQLKLCKLKKYYFLQNF